MSVGKAIFLCIVCCVEGCGLFDQFKWLQTVFYFWFLEWPFAKCLASIDLSGLPTPVAWDPGSGMHACLSWCLKPG